MSVNLTIATRTYGFERFSFNIFSVATDKPLTGVWNEICRRWQEMESKKGLDSMLKSTDVPVIHMAQLCSISGKLN